jgi:hypothetical protein
MGLYEKVVSDDTRAAALHRCSYNLGANATAAAVFVFNGVVLWNIVLPMVESRAARARSPVRGHAPLTPLVAGRRRVPGVELWRLCRVVGRRTRHPLRNFVRVVVSCHQYGARHALTRPDHAAAALSMIDLHQRSHERGAAHRGELSVRLRNVYV